MGCDIHAVLQKKNKETDKYETVLKDVFSGRDYQLYTFLSGVRGFEGKYDNIAHQGLPEGFKYQQEEVEPGLTLDHVHEGYWMGEHSFGYLSLKEFCTADTPDPDENRKYEIENFDEGYTVRFLDMSEYDDYASIRAYQLGLANFFDTYSEGSSYGETYRLVFGYDS